MKISKRFFYVHVREDCFLSSSRFRAAVTLPCTITVVSTVDISTACSMNTMPEGLRVTMRGLLCCCRHAKRPLLHVGITTYVMSHLAAAAGTRLRQQPSAHPRAKQYRLKPFRLLDFARRTTQREHIHAWRMVPTLEDLHCIRTRYVEYIPVHPVAACSLRSSRSDLPQKHNQA